jgi:hypothetical protein
VTGRRRHDHASTRGRMGRRAGASWTGALAVGKTSGSSAASMPVQGLFTPAAVFGQRRPLAASPALLAHARGEQAYALPDLGRPADALALIRAAQALERPHLPHPARLLAHRRRNRAVRRQRDADDCRRALDLVGARLA